jgi:hypothetical protein
VTYTGDYSSSEREETLEEEEKNSKESVDEGADSNNDTPLITDDLAVDQYGQKVYVNEIKLKLRILVMNQTMKKDSTEEDIEQINTAITEAREAAEGNEEVIADREA